MVDFFAFLASIAMLVAYQLYLRKRQQRDPLYTVHAVNVVARNSWVDMVMSSEKPDVLAVQTLRNSVMASSFMASTAILLLVGALTLSGSAENNSGILHALNVGGATGAEITAVKVVALLLDFFVAFFCFSMAVRFYNHVGYMISIPPGRAVNAASPGLVAAYLNRAGFFYLVGLRSFFYSVPLVFWMFGPHFMLLATLALIAALFPLDRAPRSSVRQGEPLRQVVAATRIEPKDR
ncbi:MAG TPA: DUF599 domain-containing protein [Burkholderiales bacterium]|nr:DUF599 domain-containing protein [Burkholderiales bacterium]